MSMVIKEAVERGTRKRFQTTVTNLSGDATDPDTGTCYVRLEKTGSYDDGSPTEWYLCISVGTMGQWYLCTNVGAAGTMGVFAADIWLENYMTLGDWLARFKWEIDGVEDVDSFPFTIIRRDKPYDSRPGPVL